uniref:Uncharacterized protein n=1 Tax=Mastacembelus armatus TaxID=205130 RepID=A0A7N8WMD7_9TELE
NHIINEIMFGVCLDMTVLDFHGPSQAAKSNCFHFTCDCETSVVLHVACGTGLVAKQVKTQETKHILHCVGYIPVNIVRELCSACIPGGYVCMTCRGGRDNLEYKADLERELKRMEVERLWSCVAVTEVKQWQRDMSELENSYISGSVYFYNK